LQKKALVVGVTGQDGSYLAEFLLHKGYEVYGMVRHCSTSSTERLQGILRDPSFHIVPGDLLDSVSINKLVKEIQPDEFYNLGALSFVGDSWDQPILSGEITGLGCLRCLEALRQYALECKYYFAASSEMFGKVHEVPQKETTPFHPRSPYGCAKVYGFEITRNYRESYGMFACSGQLFNHESMRRGLEFVTRKITNTVAKIKYRLEDTLYLGNLDAKRDWSDARDMVRGMWLMLQQDSPDDYVLASGETRTVREFLETAFKYAGIPIESNGLDGVEEEYRRVDTGEVVVKISPEFFRPAEVDLLLGDSTKARTILGWKPEITFDELIRSMVENDLLLVEKELK
jgi:GDPmannose 4,6-dehydratase